jgi:hypothetical protein
MAAVQVENVSEEQFLLYVQRKELADLLQEVLKSTQVLLHIEIISGSFSSEAWGELSLGCLGQEVSLITNGSPSAAHFIKRAPRLCLEARTCLQEGPQPEIDLVMRTERVGVLHVKHKELEDAYAVTLHEMPTLLETYKSHNHINLVKSADIGQMLLLHDQESKVSIEECIDMLTMMERDGALPKEFLRGLTPPMIAGYDFQICSVVVAA